MPPIHPLVAQLDNAADSDSEDRGFESLRAGHARSVFWFSKDASCNDIRSVLERMIYAYGV